MTKTVHNDVLDAALQYVEDNADKLVICSTAPTTYTEANVTYALGSATPTFTGPVDGDTSGRKTTVDAVSGATVDASGTYTHVALVDTANSKLLYVTEAGSSQAVTAGNQFSLAAWDVEIADPV